MWNYQSISLAAYLMTPLKGTLKCRKLIFLNCLKPSRVKTSGQTPHNIYCWTLLISNAPFQKDTSANYWLWLEQLCQLNRQTPPWQEAGTMVCREVKTFKINKIAQNYFWGSWGFFLGGGGVQLFLQSKRGIFCFQTFFSGNFNV